MTPNRYGSALVEFPNELEIHLNREFAAPIGLVFDVLTKPEHLTKTLAPYGEQVQMCEVDLRVGGEYHYIFLADDGAEMSFRGTFLEIAAPASSKQTWIYDGWPGVQAIESVDLEENAGITKLSYRLTFPDLASRARMTGTDGLEANFDNIEALLTSLVEQSEARLSR